jgi:diguanylate cyclase (GGDEF)-like protein
VQTYGEGEDYTDADLSLLRYVSHHISVAIERRDAANELLNYNAQLSDKVKEATAELNKTNDSLKRQIDQNKEVELKLIHDAHHDGLTNLPNRVMFNSRLALAIASKQRYIEHSFALLFIDLDRFKTINDTLGHHAGDEFLIEVSTRISACKRSHDLLARLGGDEFVVLLDNFQSLEDVEAIAQRIVESVSAPFIIEDKQIYSGASIGIAEITTDYKEADDALRDADAAMYQAKSLGRNRYVVFDISMRNQIMAEIDDEHQYRTAFKAGEFVCTIQAVSNLSDNSILYYESTINWPSHLKYSKHEHFWALADKCSLTYDVNKQLIQQAFKTLHKWRLDPDMKHMKLGLSLTVEHLLHKSAIEDLVKQIEMSEVNSELLVIELSEGALSRFPKYLPSVIEKLQSLGVTLVLDNFGSQSGSLNHILRYDFDFLKLNENLVNSFGMSDKYHNLVNSIVLISNQMGIGVIAAGVNDEMVLHELNEVGCHFVQGSYIHPAKQI